MVEIEGERVLAPSCCRSPTEGMKVTSDSERAVQSQQLVLELLLSDMPETEYTRDNELDEWAARSASASRASRSRTPGRARPVASGDGGQPVGLHPVHALRARLPRRAGQRRDRPRLPRQRREDRLRHGRSDGRLDLRRVRRVRAGVPDRRADAGARRRPRRARQAGQSVCPYCGVGCQLTYNIKDNKILYVNGRDGPANHGRLCVKGRYGFDYAHHPQRLRVPLIRRSGVPKRADFTMDPERVMDVFREATWEEALEVAGGKLARAARCARPAARSPASARPRAATRRRTCSRSSCAPAFAATTSTTARACATPRASPRCSKASARARSRTR